MGSCGFELVDDNKLIKYFFKNEKEIVCYKSAKDLYEKIKYYLDNGDERIKIAKRGYIKVRDKHTFKNRIMVIDKDFKELLLSKFL